MSVHSSTSIQKIKIPTESTSLTGLLISPKQGKTKAIIQFHSGTVTKKEYYLKLAKHIASQGFLVLIFDYRGVGESKPKSLKGFTCSISDWGEKDAFYALEYIRQNYPKLPVHLLAHSMGGQIYGLMKNWSYFDKVIFLATSSGNYNNFANSYRWKVKYPAKLLFPLLLKVFGYIPGELGLGEDWPKGVALDWLTNSQQDGLMSDYQTRKLEETYYHSIDKNITAWFFPDDTMSTPKTINNLKKSYPNANLTIKTIHPKEHQMETIGHFGLFKEKSKSTLWPLLIQELT